VLPAAAITTTSVDAATTAFALSGTPLVNDRWIVTVNGTQYSVAVGANSVQAGNTLIPIVGGAAGSLDQLARALAQAINATAPASFTAFVDGAMLYVSERSGSRVRLLRPGCARDADRRQRRRGAGRRGHRRRPEGRPGRRRDLAPARQRHALPGHGRCHANDRRAGRDGRYARRDSRSRSPTRVNARGGNVIATRAGDSVVLVQPQRPVVHGAAGDRADALGRHGERHGVPGARDAEHGAEPGRDLDRRAERHDLGLRDLRRDRQRASRSIRWRSSGAALAFKVNALAAFNATVVASPPAGTAWFDILSAGGTLLNPSATVKTLSGTASVPWPPARTATLSGDAASGETWTIVLNGSTSVSVSYGASVQTLAQFAAALVAQINTTTTGFVATLVSTEQHRDRGGGRLARQPERERDAHGQQRRHIQRAAGAGAHAQRRAGQSVDLERDLRYHYGLGCGGHRHA
jgi:hypothetical protein